MKFSQLWNRDNFKAAHLCNLFPSLHNDACEPRPCTIKQDITQDRSDSAGQMAGKKIKPVYKWYTLGPDEDKIPRPGSESLTELCCTGSYFKVLFPAVEVVLFRFWSWLCGRHFNVASRFLGSLNLWTQTQRWIKREKVGSHQLDTLHVLKPPCNIEGCLSCRVHCRWCERRHGSSIYKLHWVKQSKKRVKGTCV